MDELYATVTARIVAELEEGRLPWVQPWDSLAVVAGLPRNASSGRAYSGINILILWHALFTSHLDRYLAVRRSLGYDLTTSERILRRFTRFADAEPATHIDTALFLRWHATLGQANGPTRAARLGAVRLTSHATGHVLVLHMLLPFETNPSARDIDAAPTIPKAK